VEAVDAFLKANPVKGTERPVSQLLETMRINVAFSEKALASEMKDASFWQALGKK
jgi:hypothetical protein